MLVPTPNKMYYCVLTNVVLVYTWPIEGEMAVKLIRIIIIIIIALFIHLKIKKYNGLTFTCLRKYICYRYVFRLQIVIR